MSGSIEPIDINKIMDITISQLVIMPKITALTAQIMPIKSPVEICVLKFAMYSFLLMCIFILT
jgi:hypothetical protein